VARALALCFAAAVLIEAETQFDGHDLGPRLNLPGATKIHVTGEEAQTYGQLATQIRDHCDVLFTMPGMNSLNLWSRVPTPNGFNVTAWMTIFTRQEQDEIVTILQRNSRPCVVYNSRLTRFWMLGGLGSLRHSPIAQYIEHGTKTIAKISGYELRVPIEQRPMQTAVR
jgi:hypothetical protein